MKPHSTFQYLVSISLMGLLSLAGNIGSLSAEDSVHLRVNQIGHHPEDAKVAIAFSHIPIEGKFSLLEVPSGKVAFTETFAPTPAPGWGTFAHHYQLDFSKFSAPGRYRLKIDNSGEVSRPFTIGEEAYGDHVESLLRFMRQQRCGYNPVLDVVCHQRDGRTAFGPLPTGTFVDTSGGWHDAGDQLKYLLTGSNATARMLLAYRLEPTKFDDRTDRSGHPLPNRIPDVLDEARWGLDWLFKLHPSPDELYHQVADDRDHNGWKMPDQDSSDYGWGPNSYRVVYGADGKPQGLREFKSESTGLANIAGRCAVAMAMAHQIWKEDLHDSVFADRCLQAAREFYAMGKAKEGVQQGNSYGAPYRYSETTWADDMEWAATELFTATGDESFLDEAIYYAHLAADTTWMPHETAGHYQYYPFLNVGHFALYPHVDIEQQTKLAEYYRSGIEATLARANNNAFGVGVPFIWCSNNLTSALITQILLYERMTGDLQYHSHMLTHRDWLFGRNPWGTTMFTGIPHDGEFPDDVHTAIWKLTRRAVPGGLIDGPVYAKVYESLLGLHLENEDEFAEFQNSHVVYHDDIGDYSTNEPTMDGTADAIFMMAHFGVAPDTARQAAASRVPSPAADLQLDAGAIRRGSTKEKKLALLFTADKHVEGAESVINTLAEYNLPATFFLTGKALDAPSMRDWTRRALEDGHYVGPHSDGHLLYAPWKDRQKSLVSKERFQADLYRNLAEIGELGADQSEPIYFVPPFEWHNSQHSTWAKELGCQMINFTLGSGSHRDFAPEDHQAYRTSDQLLQEILAYENTEATGLNGHLLLLHLGTTRKDKMYDKLDELIEGLQQRGYEFVRIDKLLSPTLLEE
ncbi:glycoside hydrolase family 9 protein [Bythopirellula goksoeyrii]|uniref:Endoglucanase D n=1 Tax=Bythopirellula goksoeyrii TaxID=1400387 RepID=A0A5B9QIY9_9BACT|nr:glycoside hydrolase family 9 protein [Bythopirellula goksoeyrii]QEG37540.1 Endoglucanase D precursor [Bythopirellula goksoeyrii]